MRMSCGIGGLSAEISGRLASHSPIPMAGSVVVLVGSCFLLSVRFRLFPAPPPDDSRSFLSLCSVGRDSKRELRWGIRAF